jgi:hypothetical protein
MLLVFLPVGLPINSPTYTGQACAPPCRFQPGYTGAETSQVLRTENEGLPSLTLYSGPIDLPYGTTFMSNFTIALPSEVVAHYADGTKAMVVTGHYLDLVRFRNGREESVPLTELYMHHYRLSTSNSEDLGMVGYGAEFRGLHDSAPWPYVRPIMLPRHLKLPQLHVINTKNPYETPRQHGPVHPFGQCPCTTENQEAIGQAVMIQSIEPFAPGEEESNPYSGPDTFIGVPFRGGLLCCQHGMSLIQNKSETCRQPDCSDLPVERFYAKVEMWYMDMPISQIQLPPGPASADARDAQRAARALQLRQTTASPREHRPLATGRGKPTNNLSPSAGDAADVHDAQGAASSAADKSRERAAPQAGRVAASQAGPGGESRHKVLMPGCTLKEPAFSSRLPHDGELPNEVMYPSADTEFYIPKCRDGTPPDQCYHVISYMKPMCMRQYRNTSAGLLEAMHHPQSLGVPDRVRLVTAYPHVHLYAIYIELTDSETGEVLCRMTRANGGIRYGTGNEAGNEEGYIVGHGVCIWDGESGPVYNAFHPMVLTAAYNASEERFGVMAEWIFGVAEE